MDATTTSVIAEAGAAPRPFAAGPCHASAAVARARSESALNDASDGALCDAIDRLLPQTQCGRCGFAACRPYAEAIANGTATIDRCAPGGRAGVDALAALLGIAFRPVDPRYGAETALLLARIDEAPCIGCTLCIQACPVDAIVGAPRRMHTVVAQWCTGCGLCVPPCPVDCVAMVDAGRAWSQFDADHARTRYVARRARLERERDEHAGRLAAKGASGQCAHVAKRPRELAQLSHELAESPHPLAEPSHELAESSHELSEPSRELAGHDRKSAAIAAALERARARRADAGVSTPGRIA